MRAKKEVIPQHIRDEVYKRDNYTCRYCGSKHKKLSLDHVYPESKGGITSSDNLVTACMRCNNKKSYLIGDWPKPIGYFDNIDKINREIFRLCRPISDWVWLGLATCNLFIMIGLLAPECNYSFELILISLLVGFFILGYEISWNLKR